MFLFLKVILSFSSCFFFFFNTKKKVPGHQTHTRYLQIWCESCTWFYPELRVLVDLGGAQWVSSVDSGGRRGADVGLVGKLGWILTRVDGGRGQHPGAHAHGDLVDDAGRVGSVLHGVTRRALGGHQVGHSAGGAQGRGRRVGVKVGLGGEVGGSGSQVGVHSAVAGAVVWEGVRSLGHCGRDVGLLPSVAPGAVRGDVLLSLAEVERLLLLEMWSWPLLPVGDGSRRAP